MEPIEIEYDSFDAVPAVFKDLYEDVGGRAVLTKVNGLKTQKDVGAVQEALRKERDAHRQTSELLKPWKGLTYEEVQAKLEKFPELEAAAEGKLDETKIDGIVQTRLKQKTAPLEVKLGEFEKNILERDSEIGRLRNVIQDRDRNEVVRAAATKAAVHASAVPDIEMNAKYMLEFDESGKLVTRADIPGVTPGLDINGWLKEMQKSRTHWWPESEGGGSRGGGGGGSFSKNPWSADHWNLTEQGKVLQSEGREAADRLAAAAGSRVGSTTPTRKK